jgi:hypothetical protein
MPDRMPILARDEHGTEYTRHAEYMKIDSTIPKSPAITIQYKSQDEGRQTDILSNDGESNEATNESIIAMVLENFTSTNLSLSAAIPDRADVWKKNVKII